MTVYVRQGIERVLTLKTGISNGFSYHIAVFLFDETIVVFTVRAAPGELDTVLDAPVKELVVDELPAVITVDAEHGERQSIFGAGDLFLDPAVGAVEQGALFGPP